MSYQTLYRKHRPQRFADVIGQTHVTRTLQGAITADKLAHAYLFCGPRGTGKTTTARILARTLNCQSRADLVEGPATEPCNECESCLDITRGASFDVSEIDAATHRGIDDVRVISERAQQAAIDPSRHSVFIIDEVHQLSRDGASAFLKTLEEPPANVVFVLATTDPERMISTILSRCQRFDFRPVPIVALAHHLTEICDAEGIDADARALEAIARRSRGGVRDALTILEQAHALCESTISPDDIVQFFGGLDTMDLAGLVDAVVSHDAAAALGVVDDLTQRGIDPRILARELADYLRGVFLCSVAADTVDLVDVGEDAYENMQRQATAWSAAGATRALAKIGAVLARMPQTLDPRIELETTLIEICMPAVDPSPEALVVRVEALERRLSAVPERLATGLPDPSPGGSGGAVGSHVGTAASHVGDASPEGSGAVGDASPPDASHVAHVGDASPASPPDASPAGPSHVGDSSHTTCGHTHPRPADQPRGRLKPHHVWSHTPTSSPSPPSQASHVGDASTASPPDASPPDASLVAHVGDASPSPASPSPASPSPASPSPASPSPDASPPDASHVGDSSHTTCGPTHPRPADQPRGRRQPHHVWSHTPTSSPSPPSLGGSGGAEGGAVDDASPASTPESGSPSGEEPEADIVQLDAVLERWPVVVATIKDRNRRTGAFFADSSPVAIEDAIVTVAFTHTFNRDQATKDTSHALFSDVTIDVFGVPLGLRGQIVAHEGADDLQLQGSVVDADELDLLAIADELVPPAVTSTHPDGGGPDGVFDLVARELGGRVVEDHDHNQSP